MKIDLTWKKVSAGVIGLVAFIGAVLKIIGLISEVILFVNKVYDLEKEMKERYTRQEVQFLIDYKLSQTK